MNQADLAKRIDVKTKRLNKAKAVYHFIAAAFLVLLLFLSISTQLNTQKLLHQQTKELDEIKDSATQQTQTITDLQHHIDCIVSLFTQPNRTNLVISDITNCQLSPISTSPSSSAPSSPPPAPKNPNNQPPTNNQPAAAANPTPSPAPKPSLTQRILTIIGL